MMKATTAEPILNSFNIVFNNIITVLSNAADYIKKIIQMPYRYFLEVYCAFVVHSAKPLHSLL